MRIAMIGQKGIPATYGGIERHVEEISRRLVSLGHQVEVYCRLHYTPPGTTYHNVRLLRRPSIRTHPDTFTHVLGPRPRPWRGARHRPFHARVVRQAWPVGGARLVSVHGLDWQREWAPSPPRVLRHRGPAAHFPITSWCRNPATTSSSTTTGGRLHPQRHEPAIIRLAQDLARPAPRSTCLAGACARERRATRQAPEDRH
jgi:glycosyltransferase involved in cell wall biosynthesis